MASEFQVIGTTAMLGSSGRNISTTRKLAIAALHIEVLYARNVAPRMGSNLQDPERRQPPRKMPPRSSIEHWATIHATVPTRAPKASNTSTKLMTRNVPKHILPKSQTKRPPRRHLRPCSRLLQYAKNSTTCQSSVELALAARMGQSVLRQLVSHRPPTTHLVAAPHENETRN